MTTKNRILKVTSVTISKTTRCRHKFSCQQDGTCGSLPLCKPKSDKNCPILFIEPNEHNDCPYRTTFGHDHACLCPTHHAILNQQ